MQHIPTPDDVQDPHFVYCILLPDCCLVQVARTCAVLVRCALCQEWDGVSTSMRTLACGQHQHLLSRCIFALHTMIHLDVCTEAGAAAVFALHVQQGASLTGRCEHATSMLRTKQPTQNQNSVPEEPLSNTTGDQSRTVLNLSSKTNLNLTQHSSCICWYQRVGAAI